MKSLFSLMAIVAGLFVLDLGLISAETFTEGVRVSPETVRRTTERANRASTGSARTENFNDFNTQPVRPELVEG